MKKTCFLIAATIIITTSAAKAEEISRGLPTFALPSVQFEEIRSEISNAYSDNPRLPVPAPKGTFKDDYLFLNASRTDKFSPLSDLRKLKTIVKSLPAYLDRANLDFESHRRILEIVAAGERNLDEMLLKYSTAGERTTRAAFLTEAAPAMISLERAFLALKGNQDGGSGGSNCWSDCVQACEPTDLGDIVCHLSCYYTCESNLP